MAIGDDALAAGMDLVAGTALANTLDTEENKTRDYIAQRTNAITPVTKGGTGGATPAAARTGLGITAVATLPLPQVVRAPGTNGIELRWEGGRLVAKIDVTDSPIANMGDVGILSASVSSVGSAAANANDNADGRVAKSGDTITGHLFLPNSTAATSGFTVAYINSDGRVSRGSSSERYKKYIADFDADDLGNIWPQFVRYKMRADGIVPDDPSWRYGYIAESLIGTDAEPFVVVIDGQVESIDFIALLLAQTAQLHTSVDLLAQRVAELEENR